MNWVKPMHEIAAEYGSALYQLAAEAKKEKTIAETLKEVAFAFSENPDYFAFLINPTISPTERLASIEAVFSALPETVLHFLLLLCEKGRMAFFADAKATYLSLWEAANARLSVKIRSATVLLPEEKEKLERKLETHFKRRITASYEVDPALLGGLVVEGDGKIIDGSLKKRFEDMKGNISQ